MKKHFSVEEIEEIRRALAEQGVKDTDFTVASELNDEDKFAIVQEDENKLIDTSVLSKKVFNDNKDYIDTAVSTVSDKLDTEIADRTTKDSELDGKITELNSIPIYKGTMPYSLLGNTTSNTAGTNASAFGSFTKANGANSFTEGVNTVASGTNAHAEGSNTKATNINAHSEGDSTVASMSGSHSEGINTQANGIAAHSEGENTISNKRAAHSEGYGTQANGAYSHSEGYYTVTATRAGHTEGAYNEDDTDAVHTIGIGSSDTDRKNSEVVYKDGKKYLYGIGNYNGTKSSITNGAKDLATTISDIQTGLGAEETARISAINEEADLRQSSDKEITTSLDVVKSLIPNTATSENQLADKEFVNSSITTNTATFKGTFETVDNLPTTDVKTNDYAFVIVTDSTGNPEYQRYKYSGNAWAFEYTLNNSSFTAEQWAAITSGITSSKITTLEDADKSLTEKINSETTARESATSTNANNLATHIADTSNPHNVTASQVGASTPAEVASAISTHNTATDSHSDIRTLISNAEAKIPATTEDFVFTLEDGTEVTKSIYIK